MARGPMNWDGRFFGDPTPNCVGWMRRRSLAEARTYGIVGRELPPDDSVIDRGGADSSILSESTAHVATDRQSRCAIFRDQPTCLASR